MAAYVIAVPARHAWRHDRARRTEINRPWHAYADSPHLPGVLGQQLLEQLAHPIQDDLWAISEIARFALLNGDLALQVDAPDTEMPGS
jgi:hypothetical protein